MLYLLSFLEHVYSIIIDRSVGSPGNDIEFFDDFNANEKHLLSILITTVQLPGAAAYEL